MIKDIEKIKEIFSSKEKFLENVSDVEFVLKCYSKNMNPRNLVLFDCYSEHTDEELENFYCDYKINDYDDMEIKRVVESNHLQGRYWVKMYKECDDGYILYAEMMLDVYCDN